MQRLVVITIGKTHSGKTIFAKALEKQLTNSFVMDQDNQAEFINTYYKNLQPNQGPNILKHALSKQIVDYAKEHTNLHIIICNSNRSRKDREYLLEELFQKNDFYRILVHLDIPNEVLLKRVTESKRSTNILRGAATSFEEVLKRQQASKSASPPIDGEADRLFVIKESAEVYIIIKEIVRITESS
ncbi:ATP-binding protein [Ureibacillus chungkukjangi]|uniref:AAA family ATPase n=1 Tax=Ureibacillus chungkukjangi TaxID=1202712 RepID=UPI0038515815